VGCGVHCDDGRVGSGFLLAAWGARLSEMAGVRAVTATITREANGWFTLTVRTIENGLSRVLIERTAASIVEAQRVAEEYASQSGALCYTSKCFYR
jgi:hypothetical protein